MHHLRKNIPLIVGLAIPVLMVVAVAISIYLPQATLDPKTDFVYVVGNYPFYSERTNSNKSIEHEYSLIDGYLTDKSFEVTYEGGRDPVSYNDPVFFRYNAEEDTSQQLSFEEVQKLTLNDSMKSPEGLEVTHGRNDGFPLFFYDSDNYKDVYLKGDRASKKINVHTGSDEYVSNFQFIGWVVQN